MIRVAFTLEYDAHHETFFLKKHTKRESDEGMEICFFVCFLRKNSIPSTKKNKFHSFITFTLSVFLAKKVS